MKPVKQPATPLEDRFYNESDIGSGEKTPGERETEELIKSIPMLPHDSPRGAQAAGAAFKS